MVRLCFHPWSSIFQARWTPLHVRANCGLQSAAKGTEISSDSSSYWSPSMSSTALYLPYPYGIQVPCHQWPLVPGTVWIRQPGTLHPWEKGSRERYPSGVGCKPMPLGETATSVQCLDSWLRSTSPYGLLELQHGQTQSNFQRRG